MRTILFILLVWAILLGCFVTGVKSLATSPQKYDQIQATEVADQTSMPRADLDRADREDNRIQSGGEGRNGMQLDR